VYLANHQLTRR